MGLKDKMMNNMIDKMSKEEKAEMMESMMDKFFEDFTPEEKTEMMLKMMPRMMEGIDMSQMMPMMMAQMMGGMMGGAMAEGEASEAPSIRDQMMGEADGTGAAAGFRPPDMCRRMVEGMQEMVETNRAILQELRSRPLDG